MKETLPTEGRNIELLQDYEEWNNKEVNIKTSIPGIEMKDNHTDTEMKNLTLEYLHSNYPSETYTHVYTDGSAEDAIRNGGGGVFIKYANEHSENFSFSTGKIPPIIYLRQVLFFLPQRLLINPNIYLNQQSFSLIASQFSRALCLVEKTRFLETQRKN